MNRADPNTRSRELTGEVAGEFIETLRMRFERFSNRHHGLNWSMIEARLTNSPKLLWSLNEMERTGGEPDVVSLDPASGQVIFMDCAAESPKGRRSLCYDAKALEARKEAKPEGSAVDLAAAIGADILTEEQYRDLQHLGEFDLKTSSWLFTPERVRNLGGALFGDRRYDRVFTFHNGADSYYASRGFRTSLRV